MRGVVVNDNVGKVLGATVAMSNEIFIDVYKNLIKEFGIIDNISGS